MIPPEVVRELARALRAGGALPERRRELLADRPPGADNPEHATLPEAGER